MILAFNCDIHVWPVDGRAHLHSIAHCPYRNSMSWPLHLCTLEASTSKLEFFPFPDVECKIAVCWLSCLAGWSLSKLERETFVEESELLFITTTHLWAPFLGSQSFSPWYEYTYPSSLCVRFCVYVFTQMLVCYTVHVYDRECFSSFWFSSAALNPHDHSSCIKIHLKSLQSHHLCCKLLPCIHLVTTMYYFSLGNSLHLPLTIIWKVLLFVIQWTVKCFFSLMPALESTSRGSFATKEYAWACVCLCEFGEGGVAPWLSEQLWTLQPEPISRRVPCLLILNWLAFPVNAADTQSQLVLSENELGPQWERDREERHRYRGKSV